MTVLIYLITSTLLGIISSVILKYSINDLSTKTCIGLCVISPIIGCGEFICIFVYLFFICEYFHFDDNTTIGRMFRRLDDLDLYKEEHENNKE